MSPPSADSEERDVEASIREAFDAGDLEHAATITVERYGPEVFGFLVGHLHGAEVAGEVFQQWSELFWRTLPTFQWRCSVRTWAYKLARRAAGQHLRREHKHGREQRLTHLSRLSVAVDQVRTATASYRRTDVKSHFQRVREELPEQDQTLLMLRIDRGLSWRELAEVMLGDEAAPNDRQLDAESARLRKRFQYLKERLRKRLAEEGLLDH